MARKKKLPSKVVDYDTLSEELKALYDKFYKSFDNSNIYDLRDTAIKMSVESPTTLKKADLVKRITDKAISDYLPSEIKNMAEPWELFKDSVTGEILRGVFEADGQKYHVGRVIVPELLVKDAKLRSGDLVEGSVSDIDGQKTLVIIDNVEGEKPMERKWFEDIATSPRRKADFNSGSYAQTLLPDLEYGERVIIKNLSFGDSLKLLDSFDVKVGLFLGLQPEYESQLSRGSFIVPFDRPKEDTLRIARLALDRAKRLSERGKDVALIVYGFDSLGDRDTERSLFGVGRCFVKGSITVITDLTPEKEYGIFAKIATRII